MARTADLLTILHAIDNLHGKMCATCNYWQKRGTDVNGERIGHCLKGYRPYGADDGCDDWQAKPVDCGNDFKYGATQG